MTEKEKLHMLNDYIVYQQTQLEIHKRKIGFFGRLKEKIFGSAFEDAQMLAFHKFCNKLQNK